MKLFTESLNSARIRLLFANIDEPGSVAKGSFKNTNRTYTQRDFRAGSSSKLSSTASTPQHKAKPEHAGFADDDDTVSEASAQVTTPRKETLSTPSTRVHDRQPPASTSSRKSSRQINIGFIDEESEPEAPVVKAEPPPVMRTLSTSSSDSVTPGELTGIATVSDFMDTTSEYSFPDVVRQEIQECTRIKRAVSGTAKSLVSVIRLAEASKGRDAEDALGYKGIMDMASPITQWVINQADN